jgi:rifampin ADP-ribosylating transferase
VTNKKFPGNPTRSYRSAQPLRVVGEIVEWELHDAEFVRQLKAFVASGSGEIIN